MDILCDGGKLINSNIEPLSGLVLNTIPEPSVAVKSVPLTSLTPLTNMSILPTLYPPLIETSVVVSSSIFTIPLVWVISVAVFIPVIWPY